MYWCYRDGFCAENYPPLPRRRNPALEQPFMLRGGGVLTLVIFPFYCHPEWDLRGSNQVNIF